MISDDQRLILRYDRPLAGTCDVQLSYALASWLDIHLGALGGAFGASGQEKTGGLVAPIAGLSFRTSARRISPYLQIDAGSAFTGADVRFMGRAGLGVDIAIRDGVSLGPVLGYGHIRQKNGPNYTEDARFLWAGLSLGYRRKPPPKSPEPPKPTERIHERVVVEVVEREVQVPYEPAAPDPELLALLDRAVPASVVRTELVAPVLFKFNSIEFEPLGTAMLHEVAHTLQQRQELELIAIEGYADTRGADVYNLQLSARRAQRVFEWLVSHGIASERLYVVAGGESQTVEPGEDESSHTQNRRVVFRVLRTAQP